MFLKKKVFECFNKTFSKFCNTIFSIGCKNQIPCRLFSLCAFLFRIKNFFFKKCMISNHFYCTVCHIYFIVTKLHFSILYLKMCIGIFTEARLLFDSLSTSWYSTFAKLFWKINKKKNKINYNKVFLKW